MVVSVLNIFLLENPSDSLIELDIWMMCQMGAYTTGLSSYSINKCAFINVVV